MSAVKNHIDSNCPAAAKAAAALTMQIRMVWWPGFVGLKKSLIMSLSIMETMSLARHFGIGSP